MSANNAMALMLAVGMGVATCAAQAPLPDAADPAWGAALPWSRFAQVETLPGMQAIQKLNDGDPESGPIWCPGGEGGGEVAVRFPQPLEVTVLRFVQHGGATRFRLTADLDGKSDFTTVIQERADLKDGVKAFISVPVNRKVHGLKLAFMEGVSGYRAPFPALGEIEIYSKQPAPPARTPAVAAPVLKSEAVKPLPAFARKAIDIRLCIDTWHAGVGRNADGAALEENKTFQEMIKRFREADANSARLFAETACCDDEMPWKSEKLWPGHGFNQLAPLAQALHKNGLKLYFFSHAWMSPFQKRGERTVMPYCRWDYPYEQSDRLVGVDDHYTVTYPCVISDPGFRDQWLQMLGEAIDQGADGVYLMPDEYYFKGHNLSRVNCPLCQAGFKKMYGYDALPTGGGFTVSKSGATSVINRGKVEDTEPYRKWKLFEYRKIAELFHHISAELRKRHPKAQIVMSDNKITEDLQGRLEHTMALDIVENDPNADFAQMYGNVALDRVGWISAYARRIAAAAGGDKLLASIQWLGVQDSPTNYPIQLFGYALPQIMLGAKVYENYRLNYMYDKGWWPNALECHKMIRLLEQWGVAEAKTPDVACLLLSRASEDWWRTKLEGMCGAAESGDVAFNLLYAGDDINKAAPKTAGSDRDRVLKLDALRGVGAKLAMESLLCERAVPYRVAFTDRFDNLEDLQRFKLLVMPFSYSLSKAAFEKVKAAVDAGVTLAIFGPLAPVDEFGNPYPEPLLQALVGKPNVIHIPDNLAAVGNSAVKRAEYAKRLAPVLDPLGYSFEAVGLPVECIVRNLPDRKGYLVYLGNWDGKRAARPVIVLPSLTGKPKIEVYSSASHSLSDASATDGKGMAVDLAPAEVKLIRIQVE
jgi:hypothetical protein